MISPRDTPYNYVRMEPMTENQQHHLEQINDAAELLYNVMHMAEGTQPPGEHQEHQFQTRRMSIAATHLETAVMYARKAALESR